MSYLSLSNVSKVYKVGTITVNALKNVTFDLNDGELVVVLGSSGAGKTTLLNLLGGMDAASSGKIVLDGSEITNLDRRGLTSYRRNDVGFVFQFYNLMPNLTAFENVALACTEGGLDVGELMRGVGLEKRRNNFPAQLSGGEQQRVAIARAIVKKPKLLLCDEPTGALDSKTGQKIIELLSDIRSRYGTTVVVVTHNASLAGVADRVIRLADGRVTQNALNKNVLKAGEIEW